MASVQSPVRDRRSWTSWSWLVSILAASAVIVSAVAPAACAGQISPALQDELSHLGLNQQATAVFMLARQADIPTLNRALKLQHATRRERHRQVVEALKAAAQASQGPFLAELAARTVTGEVAGYTPYWIANLVVVRATRAALEDLAARSDIDRVERDPKASLIAPVSGEPRDGGTRGIGVTPGLRAIHAPEVWYQLGINGTGVLVANLDTGVDGHHPALESRWRGNNGHPWQECWLDVLGTGTQYPTDTYGHGTHVMGTITGLGAATQDTVGVAWGAEWIATNAINQGVGPEFDNDILTCLQWLTDPDGNPNTVDDVPDVVQNSWGINEGFGGSPPYTDCDTRWWTAIDNCEAASVCITWSAGNEGPTPGSLRSPADRATTPYNVFSIGAVDATNSSWPYPIASWSSRGPTGCDVPDPLKIKPEVCAPGVDIYSSIPGGGYTDTYSGTSMAGPHVAGVVGLMRSANPDIDVETIKQILMDTSRDEGTAGEDNTYGYGFIDAYEAVLQCLSGYGTLAGSILNGSNGGTPVPGAGVRLVEINRTFLSDGTGHYSGMAQPGTYTVEVTHPSFATLTVPGIELMPDQITPDDFTLTDTSGPAVTGVQFDQAVQNPDDPLPVSATITDFSAIALTEVVWRVDGGDWSTVPMTSLGSDSYQGLIPYQPIGSHIEFYIHATDIADNEGFAPPDAPNTLYDMYVVQSFFADDFETDRGWSPSLPTDTQYGRWARWAPLGTQYNGQQAEPEGDHTPPPGTLCYETGVGQPGGTADGSDVDNGCVTLTSPLMDLSQAETAFVSYWRWFALLQTTSGLFIAEVSNDGGLSWTVLELLGANANSWTNASFNIADFVPLTRMMRFRFVVCDNSDPSIVEGAVDDFSVAGIPNLNSSAPGSASAGTALLDCRPNPFTHETTLRYRLASAGTAALSIYDPAGRLVRRLSDGPQTAGAHSVLWDGRDAAGRPAPAGMYFYELKADGYQSQKKMLMLK